MSLRVIASKRRAVGAKSRAISAKGRAHAVRPYVSAVPRAVGVVLVMVLFLGTVAAGPAWAGARHSRTVRRGRKTPPAARVVPVTVSPNLVSRWSGDGTARDVIGGHDGVLENGAGFAPGRFGKAFLLSGHQYVRIPFDLAFDFAPGDRFTVSAWVKPAALGSYQAVLVKSPPGGPWEWGIIIDPQDHFYTGRDAHDVAQSRTAVQPGHWYHVAVTYQNGALMMYVNGALENQVSGVFVGQSLGGLALGHKGDTALAKEDPDWYTGLIDDVRLYNRALSASEIALLFHGQEIP